MTLDLNAPFARIGYEELEKKAEVIVYQGVNDTEKVIGYLNLADLLDISEGACVDLSKLAFGSNHPDKKRGEILNVLRKRENCLQLDDCSAEEAYSEAVSGMGEYANHRGFLVPGRQMIIMLDQVLKGVEIFKYALVRKNWISRYGDKKYHVNSWSQPPLKYAIPFSEIKIHKKRFPKFKINHCCLAKSYFAANGQGYLDFGLLCKHEVAAILYAAYVDKNPLFEKIAAALPVPSSILNSMFDIMRRQKTLEDRANEFLVEALALKIVKGFGVKNSLVFGVEPGDYFVKAKEDPLQRLAVAVGRSFA